MPPDAHPADAETQALLAWAHVAAADDEIVAMFWNQLREAVNVPPGGTPAEVFRELSTYGGNTIANAWRGAGVPYAEVAYDVAEALRGAFKERPFTKEDVRASEAYVLKKMEVKEEDLAAICAAIGGRAVEEAVNAEVTRLGGAAVVRGVSGEVAKVAVAKVGGHLAAEAAKKAAAEAAKKAAAEAAKKAAKKAAVEAAKKAAQKAAEATAQRVLAGIVGALNVIMIAWTVIDLAGPARRVTIPAVTYVALLRKMKAFVDVQEAMR